MPYSIMWLRQMGNTRLTTAYIFLYHECKQHKTKALRLATTSIKNVSDFEC